MKQQEAINAVWNAKGLVPIIVEPTLKTGIWKVYVEDLWTGLTASGASIVTSIENRLAKVGAQLYICGEETGAEHKYYVIIGDMTYKRNKKGEWVGSL